MGKEGETEKNWKIEDLCRFACVFGSFVCGGDADGGDFLGLSRVVVLYR